MVLVSAHRPADLEAVRAAVLSGVDLVELDVHRCCDGVLVLHHDGVVTGPGGGALRVADLTHAQLAHLSPTTTLDACLEVLAGRAGAHLDLKVTSPHELYAEPALTWEVAAVRRVLAALGEGAVVVTTDHRQTVRAVRTWALATGRPDLLVGLSLGADPPGPLPRRALRLVADLFPTRQLRACGANLVVANAPLARLTLARWARRHHLPLLVWTVDAQRELTRWLGSSAWAVTTNDPGLALRLRAAGAPAAGVSRRRRW